MYKFNADLELRDVQPEDRIAVYREEKTEEHAFFSPAHVIINQKYSDEKYIVASFDDYLHCNNACGFPDYKEAWKFFLELVQEDLESK